MLGNEALRELVVAVRALVGEPLVQSGGQSRAMAALGLSQSVCRRSQLVRMRHLFARGKRQERGEAGINADLPISDMQNVLGLCVDEETQIPARRTADDPPALETPLGDVLAMKPDRPYPWNVDTCAIRRFERIRKREARQRIAPPFERGLLGQFLVTPLPSRMRHMKYPL